MSIMERIKALISSDQRTVEQVRAAIVELEAELGTAEATLIAEEKRHDTQALELISRPSDAIEKSRAQVEAARANADHLRRALAGARVTLELAETERAIDDLAMRWELSRRLLQQRVEKAAELQALLADAALLYGELLDLTEKAYQSLPAKPDSRPLMMTQAGLGLAVETFLYGATDGRLVRAGGASSAYMARQRPDLVSVADDMCGLLMAQQIETVREVKS